MYDKTVTVFNYYESAITGKAYWYPHVLPDVDLVTDHGAILKKYGPDSADNAVLHVSYVPDGGNVMVRQSGDSFILWLAPKEWSRQVNDDLPERLTFGPDDFFWLGEWTGGTVTDDDYLGGFYQYMNTQRDNVYKVSSVGGPYTVIPHFEILGK